MLSSFESCSFIYTTVCSGLLSLDFLTRLPYLLKSEYLQQFLNDFRDIMVYDESTEYLNDNLIKTENTNLIDS